MGKPSIAGAAVLRGRDAERGTVAALVRRAWDGNGGALVVQGVAGSGKSALVEDVLRGGATAGDLLTVIAVRARRREQALPFAAVHALLSPLTGPADCGRRVARAVADGQTGADRLYRVCAEIFDMLAEHGRPPVLWWIDDAQWLDPHSIDALGFVASRIGSASGTEPAPVSILITQRPDGPAWDLPLIALDPLDLLASLAVLGDLAPPDLCGDVAHALAATAGGNPGALTELAAALSPDQRRGDVDPPVSLPPGSRLRRDYAAALNRLPASTRRLLLLVAADPMISAGELVRGASLADIDITALDPAERDGLVRVVGDEVTMPDPLLRTITYEEATLSQRRAAHLVLAEVLDDDRRVDGDRQLDGDLQVDRDRHEARRLLHRAALAAGPDSELAESLAQAAARASDRVIAGRALIRAAQLSADPALAAHRLIAAARRQWDGGEPHRARALLRRVQPAMLAPADRVDRELLLGEIELSSGGSARAGQALLAAAEELRDPQRRVAALLRAGEALCLAGEYPDFAQLAGRTLTLRRPDEPLESQLVFEQFTGLTAMFRGDYVAGTPALRRVIALATVLDEPGALIRASTAAIVLGDDACAYRLADRAAGLARTTGRHQLVPQALELAATAQCALGRYEPASTTLIDALRLSRATGQESLTSSLIAFMAVLAATLGDRHTCLTRIDEVRTSEAWAQGASRAAALVEWALSILALVDGRPADAVPRLFGLMREESGQGQLAIWIAAAPHLVEACVRAGDRHAARRALAIFEPWARNTHNSAWLALAERCCALVSDDPQCMVDHFNEALVHHQIAGAEFERARTQLLFGQELRRGRRPGAAREHLQAAHDVFARFEATPLLAQASAELRAAGVRVAPRQVRRPATVLTAQQLQIARMAAGGATNREVAAALFISTRTVDYHMRNILSRLGVRSRVDLAKVLGDATAA